MGNSTLSRWLKIHRRSRHKRFAAARAAESRAAGKGGAAAVRREEEAAAEVPAGGESAGAGVAGNAEVNMGTDPVEREAASILAAIRARGIK